VIIEEDVVRLTESYMEWWLNYSGEKVYVDSHGVELTEKDLEEMLKAIREAKEEI
tara:strand:+ start:35501 stop:35665 length:165 start_codon:yes stop_codon:yes gene_type:complete